ncbi:MAG: hypothetical protein R3C28_11345 [Pirellulaceae bacterium]
MKNTRGPIVRPFDRNSNPARRGGDPDSPLKWRAELLLPGERRREVILVAWYLILFSIALQLAAGTIPGFKEDRGVTLVLALIIAKFLTDRHPLFFQAAGALSPFCLLAPWYTEWLFIRHVIAVGSTLLAAYQFRQHLIGLVSSGPIPAPVAKRYRASGHVPKEAQTVSFVTGYIGGFALALSSWFTYLGNEQRLETVYQSPAGFCYSRTFLTILGVFGMVLLLPHDFIFLVLAKNLTVIHPKLVYLVFFLVLLGPVVAMTVLAFVFTADRLRSAVSMNRYGTLENTFADLMKDLAPKESEQ